MIPKNTNTINYNRNSRSSTIACAIAQTKTSCLVMGGKEWQGEKTPMFPEESVLLGYAAQAPDSVLKVAAYKIRNGQPRLVSAYWGNPPFRTGKLEQSAINWATAAMPLPNGSYLGGYSLPPNYNGERSTHKAALPQHRMVDLTQELIRFDQEAGELNFFGLDHPMMMENLDTDLAESVSFDMNLLKRCLFSRFLVGLYGPAPEVSGFFRSVVNNIHNETKQSLQPKLVKMYELVTEFLKQSQGSLEIVRTKNFNFKRQENKLLKIVNFLSLMAGKTNSSDKMELYKTSYTRREEDCPPLLNIVTGPPVSVQKGANVLIPKNFVFPRTWTKSPFEEQTAEEGR